MKLIIPENLKGVDNTKLLNYFLIFLKELKEDYSLLGSFGICHYLHQKIINIPLDEVRGLEELYSVYKNTANVLQSVCYNITTFTIRHHTGHFVAGYFGYMTDERITFLNNYIQAIEEYLDQLKHTTNHQGQT